MKASVWRVIGNELPDHGVPRMQLLIRTPAISAVLSLIVLASAVSGILQNPYQVNASTPVAEEATVEVTSAPQEPATEEAANTPPPEVQPTPTSVVSITEHDVTSDATLDDPASDAIVEPSSQLVAAASSTETAVPTLTPDPTPTPEPTSTPALPNTDTLTAASSVAPITLDPGQKQQYAFVYTVTTPRTGTAMHAALRLADGSPAIGWGLGAQAGGGDWVSGDGAVDVTEWSTLVPVATFTLSIIVTAPAGGDTEQTASLYISSTAHTDRGDETGVEASGPLASLTVVLPPPEPNSLSCDALTTTEIAPGEVAEMSCVYTVSDPAAPASVTAAFETAPGEGWTLAIGDGPAGEIATWSSAEPLAEGTTVDLTVRVVAPADAEAEQQATVTVTAGDPDRAVTWLLTVVAPVVAAGDFSVMSVDPTGGICTQIEPDGDILPPGTAAKFTCGSGGLNASDWYEVRISAPSEGWYYRVNSEPPSAQPSTYTPQQLLEHMNGTFTIELRMLSYLTNTSVGSLTVEYYGRYCQYSNVCENRILRSATLSITWPAPDVTCELIGPAGALVGPGEYATFKCTHSNPGFQLRKTSDDARWLWAVSTGEAPVTPPDWSVWTDGTDWTTESIFLYLKPNPNFLPPLGSPQNLPIEFRQQESQFVTQKTLTITYNAIHCAPAVNVFSASFGTSSWDGEGYTPVTATFGMAFRNGGGPDCGGFTDDWSVQISSDGLTDGGDGRIAPSDISYIFRAGVPSAGLTVVTTNQPLVATGTGTTKIADGNSHVLPGALWNFTLRLQPPNDAPPGDYSGTITITIAGDD